MPRKAGRKLRQDSYKAVLFADPNVKRWYDNLARSSPPNADKCVQRLGFVCKQFKTTPAEMARLEQKQAQDLILDVISKLHEEKKQPTYMQDYTKSLKSWFLHNGIKIRQKVKLPKAHIATKAATEQPPTPDLVRRLLDAADIKQKVESTLVAFAGVRPEVVGNYLGNDGLKVGDLPEMRVDNATATVTFEKMPAIVSVRSNLSKAGHRYFTFMPAEGCEYIKMLLEFRIKDRKETLNADTPIVNSIRFNKHYGFIRTSNIGDSIRQAIRKANFDWRPYILRTYFDTRMMMAEADGLIIRDWRVFWMGHKGDIEARYTTNKGKLSDDLVEKMREAFAKASDKYLVTSTKRDTAIDAVKAQFNRQFLLIAGFSEQEADTLGDLSQLSPADISKLVQEKQKRALGLNGNTQKVVPIPEVKQYIMQGWEYVALLQDEAIIKLPAV